MTPAKLLNLLLLSAFIPGCIMMAGCQSTGMERSNETRISLQTMNEDVKSAILQLDATGAALDDLLRPGQPDLKKALETFSDNVAQIVATETKFVRHADELTARGTFRRMAKRGDRIQKSADTAAE